MERLIEQIKAYIPWNEQEAADQKRMLEFLKYGNTPFSRDNSFAHFTASAWVVNPDRTKILMVYHNIYHSWAWTGGHADGETDLLAVALREISEETGVQELTVVSPEIFSLEVLTVDGHEKRGAYVASHLHMNVTYLFEAEEEEALRIKPDENSGVQWIPLEELSEKVSEPWMLERIYKKLCQKSRK